MMESKNIEQQLRKGYFDPNSVVREGEGKKMRIINPRQWRKIMSLTVIAGVVLFGVGPAWSEPVAGIFPQEDYIVVSAVEGVPVARGEVLGAAGEGNEFLTIYAYPPRAKIDWSTPKSALRSFLEIEAGKALTSSEKIAVVDDHGDSGGIEESYKSTMGHTIAHVECTLPEGGRFDSWTSMSGQNYAEVDKENSLRKQIGAGQLFYPYIDGHIISGEENIKRLVYLKNRAGYSPRYWRNKINGGQCRRLKEMIEFYKGFHFPPGTPLEALKKRPPAQTLYFTGALDPYESYQARKSDPDARVGGGCAPYGVGLKKLIGKYDDGLDGRLIQKIEVSEALIGGPQDDGSIRKVSVGSLLFGKLGDHWTYPGYKSRTFSSYDPYLIWKFIGEVRACYGVGEVSEDVCSEAARRWLGDRNGSVSIWEPQTFRDTRVVHEGRFPKKVTTTVKIAGIQED